MSGRKPTAAVRRARRRRYKTARDERSGLTSWIAEQLKRQHNRCRTCKREFSPSLPYVVDHDHSCCRTVVYGCGKCWRGLLCVRCNNGIGFFEDSIDILTEVISYLREYAESRQKKWYEEEL